MLSITISKKLNIQEWQVKSVLQLLNSEASVPFIARYRKEKTGNLDEVLIRKIEEEQDRHKELEKRRAFILSQIEELGKLTPELKNAIALAADLETLEDLYLPYKTKRLSRAETARAAGYEPLAKAIFSQKGDDWKQNWRSLVKDATPGFERCVDFALDIVAEWMSEDAGLRAKLRVFFEKSSTVVCKVTRGKIKEPAAQKYANYFNYAEAAVKCPSHRLLAMLRGETEGWLKLHLEVGQDEVKQVMRRHLLKGYGESQRLLIKAMEDSWTRLLHPSLESEMLRKMNEQADEEAISVFADNVSQLLLKAPLGEKRVLAIDPGFKSGCKLVCLGQNGDLLHHQTIFPHEPQKAQEKSKLILTKVLSDYKIECIAIGNGTAGRETQEFIQNIENITQSVYMVNESGASIYSASEVAREEFPDKDLTIRGAVSIGRRLMDPLAELVKIDPKSIGVGQYQHDVNQTLLKKRLESVVESAVNRVGVNLNTASRHLLSRVSGLGPVLAKNIVDMRTARGPFKSREQLKTVPRLGEKAFEQSAGFLRIRDASNPLDNSAVHPERYHLVEKMASDLSLKISELLNNSVAIENIQAEKYVNPKEDLGLPTIKDILFELGKPGLDPRGNFEDVGFKDSVRTLADLDAGMELNGIVTNILDFGAFVDIGVKQDGLVHISAMSHQFIKHPKEVVHIGQQVKVRITEVDKNRKRIGLTMRF